MNKVDDKFEKFLMDKAKDEKSKFYLIIGIGIAFLFYLVSSFIRLKKDGVLYDERDSYIEEKANAISYNVFHIYIITQFYKLNIIINLNLAFVILLQGSVPTQDAHLPLAVAYPHL